MLDTTHEEIMRPAQGVSEQQQNLDDLSFGEEPSYAVESQGSAENNDPVTQRQIAELQAMLRGAAEQGTESSRDISAASLLREAKTNPGKLGVLSVLKSLFHYLTFNLFKRR